MLVDLKARAELEQDAQNIYESIKNTLNSVCVNLNDYEDDQTYQRE